MKITFWTLFRNGIFEWGIPSDSFIHTNKMRGTKYKLGVQNSNDLKSAIKHIGSLQAQQEVSFVNQALS